MTARGELRTGIGRAVHEIASDEDKNQFCELNFHVRVKFYILPILGSTPCPLSQTCILRPSEFML